MRDVQHELVFAVALVVLVTFLFLRNVPATIIPSVVVPLSLIGTFGVMYLAGFSVNNLTLMALTIATGFVVDDAIVMMENIARHIEEGATPFRAALVGAQEIGFTLVSLTISLIAVLIPLLFMADVVGRLFREFAITLAVSILISLVVSLTLTPMMSARLLRTDAHRAGLVLPEERRGARLDDRRLWPAAAVGAPASGVDAARGVRDPRPDSRALHRGAEGLFPGAGHRRHPGHHRGPAIRVVRGDGRRQQAAARTILAEPDVTGLSSFIGVDGSNATLNSGRMLVTLAPHEERKRTATAIIASLRSRLQSVPGITVYLQPVQDLTIEDRVSRTQFQFILEDPDAKRLSEWVPKLVERLRAAPELLDVASDLQDRGLQAFLNIDRDAASRLGVSVSAIDDALYDAFGQRLISTIYTQANQYRVVLEAAPQYQVGPGGARADLCREP